MRLGVRADLLACQKENMILQEKNLTDSSVLWRAWTTDQLPLPPPPGHSCAWAETKMGPMCLMKRDLISDTIRKIGHWPECDKLANAFTTSANRQPDPGVFLELGANIGTCTLLLLHANATVIAFEPSPANLFYLTSTLAALKERRPELARRVTIFPLAASDIRDTMQIVVGAYNAGHSMIVSNKDLKNNAGSRRYQVEARALDKILPASLKVAIMKVDIEGHECRAVEGLQRLLSSGRVGRLAIEFTAQYLRKAGCSPTMLGGLLSWYGFHVAARLPPCVYSTYGCDLMLTRSMSQPRCTWRRVNARRWHVPVPTGDATRNAEEARDARLASRSSARESGSETASHMECIEEVAHRDRHLDS